MRFLSSQRRLESIIINWLNSRLRGNDELLLSHPDILLSCLGELATARSTFEESDFEEIRFDDVFDCVFFFSYD